MLGSFLEISLTCEDIQASLGFYEALAFEQLPAGEIWSHPYCVITDGNLVLGLHQYEFQSPSLTWVRAGIDQSYREYLDRGIEFAFLKIADDEFNELGFLDPDGQMVTVLEARTFSPFAETREDFSLLGHFSEYSLGSRNSGVSADFWEGLGFVLTSDREDPLKSASLMSSHLNLGLYAAGRLRRPGLTFRERDMVDRIEYLRASGYALRSGSPIAANPGDGVVLRSPEGLDIHLLEEES